MTYLKYSPHVEPEAATAECLALPGTLLIQWEIAALRDALHSDGALASLRDQFERLLNMDMSTKLRRTNSQPAAPAEPADTSAAAAAAAAAAASEPGGCERAVALLPSPTSSAGPAFVPAAA